MNPNLCRIVLRPRGVLEVFDLAVALLRTHARTFLRLWALLVVPPTIVIGAASAALEGEPALLLAPILLAPLLQAPGVLLGGRLLFADEVRVRDVLRELWARKWGWLGAWAVSGLAAAGGCGVFSWVFLAPVTFLPEATLLERSGLGRGLRRSTNLAVANPGIAVTSVLAWGALTVWGAVVGEATGQAVVAGILQLGEPFGQALDLRATPYLLWGMLAVQPVYGVYHVLLYVDARTRVEGWDLQVGLMAAAAEARR